MTKYFVNEAGEYLGGWDGTDPPVGAIEIPVAPDDARQIWANGAWSMPDSVALEIERATMVCSRFQARAALLAAGLLASVEAAVAQADQFTQIAWADAVEFRRNSPTIAALQGAVGLTDAQIDDLFRAAMQIQA